MHDHAALVTGAGGVWPVLLALFSTGLVGGFAHCATMCGPFVLAQVAGGLAGRAAPAGLGLQRLRGGLLLPYHLGRATTYSLLGAAAGGLSGMVVQYSGFSWAISGFLLLAALLFMAQGLAALGFARRVGSGAGAARVGARLARWLGPLFRRPGGPAGYLLGVGLGFLPCGFLYAALASAAGTGSALGGGLAMAAFTAGTMVPLILVGTLGAMAGSGWTRAMRRLAPVLYLANGLLLLVAAGSATGQLGGSLHH